jgi:hemolysin activation/secretion protein
MPFSLDYSGNAQGKSGTTQYSLATVFSFRGVGNNADDLANARFRAQPNFFILRWDVQRNQNLPWWGLSLGMRFDGQLADQPLINNEQYFAGGLMNVRGYLESEALGDRAVHGSLELRGPNIAGDSGSLQELRVIAFTEGAQLRVVDPLPTQQERFTLSSTGMGLRARANHVELWLNFAVPIKSTLYTQAHHGRTQFSAVFRF